MAILLSKQNRESTEGCWKGLVQANQQDLEKDWFQQVEHMQVPNGTGPDVQKSEGPCWYAIPITTANISLFIFGSSRPKLFILIHTVIWNGLVIISGVDIVSVWPRSMRKQQQH